MFDFSCFLFQTDPETKSDFGLLSLRRKTTQLRDRFEFLKTWLRTAEHASVVASGTQENDGDLHRLIGELSVQEGVGLLFISYFPCSCGLRLTLKVLG